MSRRPVALQASRALHHEEKARDQARRQDGSAQRRHLNLKNNGTKHSLDAQPYLRIDELLPEFVSGNDDSDGLHVRDEIYIKFASIISEEYSEIDPHIISEAVSAAEEAIQRVLFEKQGNDDPASGIKKAPVKVVPLRPSEMDATILDEFCQLAILRIAPFIETLEVKEKEKVRIKALKIISRLDLSHLDEIQIFLFDDGLNAESLSQLSLKCRSVVLDIHYLKRIDWQEVRSARPTPDDWLAWLDDNFSDRHTLGLLQSDVARLDPPAYQKLMKWTQPNSYGVITALPDFGLPTKTEVYKSQEGFKNAPTSAEAFEAYRRGDPRASALKRSANRAQYYRSVSPD